MVNLYNYIVPDKKIQEQDFVLSDSKKWQPKKLNTLELSKLYKLIGNDSKARRVYDCGSYLEFKRFLESGELKLHSADFCHIRMCPMCSWRRSMKIFAQLSMIMNVIEKDYRFLFLTLTVQNCDAKELDKNLDLMFKAFSNLTKVKKFKSISGYYRSLEITYNKKDNTYHPHFHVILAVKNNYFTKNYINQSEWTDMWQNALKIDYKPLVDIRRVKDQNNNINRTVAELAKYTVKDNEFLKEKDKELASEILAVYDLSLTCRRLIGYGGIFKRVKEQLKLDDVIDGDLINVGDNEVNKDLAYVIETYKWSCTELCGHLFGEYYLTDIRSEV